VRTVTSMSRPAGAARPPSAEHLSCTANDDHPARPREAHWVKEAQVASASGSPALSRLNGKGVGLARNFHKKKSSDFLRSSRGFSFHAAAGFQENSAAS
jgi:hypothetical protein